MGIGALRPAVLGLGRVVSIGLSSVAAAPLTERGYEDDDHHEGGTPIWVLAIASLALTLIGGVFAGLTIALVFFVRSRLGSLLMTTQLDGAG
jgi:metal transporter CNNM